jgi:hypothetical protein
MADEIRLSASLSVVRADAIISGSRSKAVTQAGDEAMQQLVSVGFASDQALDLSILDTMGHLMIENLDPDGGNYVEVSKGTGGAFAAGVIFTVYPGCPALLVPPTKTLYAKANVAAVNIRMTAAEL